MPIRRRTWGSLKYLRYTSSPTSNNNLLLLLSIVQRNYNFYLIFKGLCIWYACICILYVERRELILFSYCYPPVCILQRILTQVAQMVCTSFSLLSLIVCGVLLYIIVAVVTVMTLWDYKKLTLLPIGRGNERRPDPRQENARLRAEEQRVSKKVSLEFEISSLCFMALEKTLTCNMCGNWMKKSNNRPQRNKKWRTSL